MYRIFIGWDEHEIDAYHVLCHSLIRHASAPISITPLKWSHLDMWRERNPLQSTEFSFSRFLVPSLSEYQGWSLFMDVDMMFTHDVVDLFKEANEKYAVQVVKHDYTPKTETKFLDQPQSKYERKNWSSVMLFNNNKCRALTPHIVNVMDGLWLHRFHWLHDSQIGELSKTWNWLVGEEEWKGKEPPYNLHWTIGGPWFKDYRDAPFADLWNREKELVNAGT